MGNVKKGDKCIDDFYPFWNSITVTILSCVGVCA
jgi:hypothetical protein